MRAHAIVGRAKSKDEMSKYPEVCISHLAVMALLVVELSASAWTASVPNGGDSCARCIGVSEKHMILMKIVLGI